MSSSTTGNNYGIYELSGAANEYVATFNDTDDKDFYSSNGWTGLTINSDSNCLATRYSNNTSIDSGKKIYEEEKIGDATKEVKKGEWNPNWNYDKSNFVYKDFPFFGRGGMYNQEEEGGIFYAIGGSRSMWFWLFFPSSISSIDY